MNDHEIAALAAAFKSIVAEQALALRAQLAELRADLHVERVKNAEYRRLQSQSHQQMMKAMGDAVVDAVRPRFAELQQRTAQLEQRATP